MERILETRVRYIGKCRLEINTYENIDKARTRRKKFRKLERKVLKNYE